MAVTRTVNLSSQAIISEAKPNITDLRSFIEKVRQEFPEDVLTIKKEMDPRFEIATLVQTQRVPRFPLILFGREYWRGLLRWLKTTTAKRGAG